METLEPTEYHSYIEDLEPFESPEQQHQVITSHLKGLKGQMETLIQWEHDKAEYHRFYEKTFGNEKKGPEFHKTYQELTELLLDEEKISREDYDKIYKEWELLSKELGQ